jgi:hypothetical protein
MTTTKIRRIKRRGVETLLGWTGDQDAGEYLAEWYTGCGTAAEWPDCQKDKDSWSRLIVINPEGVWTYSQQPIAIKMEDLFMAWGSGRDFAIAAMHLGKDAVEAVKVASRFETGCGNGFDHLALGEPE